MQAKVQQDLETNDPGGRLKPLGWCNKGVERNAIVMIVVRFGMTRMQHRLEESSLSCTCWRNCTEVIGIGNWKICVIKLGNQNWKLEEGAKEDPMRGLTTKAREVATWEGRHTEALLGYLGKGQLQQGIETQDL